MRKLILILALTLLPCGANAASIGGFDGRWSVDLAATAKKSPEMMSDKGLPELVLIIDAKAMTLATEYPGEPDDPASFTIEREGPGGIVIKLGNDRFLKLQAHGKDRLAVGELRNQEPREVVYFFRP